VQGIRDAKFLIWAAVAWFSNEAINRELLAKKKQGLNIRLIISDEDTNQKLLPKLQNAFDVIVIPRHGWNEYNRMHDKFCIVDLEYVMHGSYNWTATANYNEETLATALDREFVKKFADEFIRMYAESNH
jgi:phosphatidylserine/phosphatidylglycerophosphate/cardiolipin synthase-like enzyme